MHRLKGNDMKFKRLIAMLMCFAMFIAPASALAEYEFSPEYDVFEQVAGYISTYYIDDTLDDSQIMLRAISEYLKDDDGKLLELLKSMLLSLDPYSEFFTREEYLSFVNNINRTFYGIGVRIEQREGYVVITGFTQGSSAEACGMMVGDKISQVNGEDMYGKNTNTVRNAIAGELGKAVTVSVLRNGETYTYDVKRCEVNEDTVTYLKLSDDVAYISVIDMSDHTAEEFTEALNSADKDGIKNIILDLRNNGGGYLDCAVKLGRMVVPEGVIVDTKYRQPYMNQTFYSELKSTKYKFNVLVNEYTASAAEILAGAMQDSKAGTLIGTKTYGKGVIQGTFPLSNGSVFKLTIGHYLTRNGNAINEVGLFPDVEVENVLKPIDIKDYTSFSFSEKLKLGYKGNDVKSAKEKLYYLGYYNGEINDEFDLFLEEAIKDFQEKMDLYSYGVLDLTTQSRIDKEFSKLEILVDAQLNKAYEMFTGEKEIPNIK